MKYLSALIFIFAAAFSYATSFTKEFTEAELQQEINSMMPLETNIYFVTLVFTNPEIKLHETSDEFSLKANIDVLLPNGQKGSGSTNISGSISYQPESGTFYLHNPNIIDLHVNDVLEEYQAQIKQVAQLAISNAFTTFPLYTLQDDNLEQQLAKSILESVVVENGKLLVTFKLD